MAEQGGADLTGRAGLVWHLYAVQRWTQGQIARELNLSQQRISQILADVRAALPAEDRAEMVRQSIELHADVIRRAYALAEMAGAPVTAGKDGDVVIDPEGGAVVRDYAGRVAALRLALSAEAELRKLMGLDAATKVESSATVRYVLEGVSVDDLT